MPGYCAKHSNTKDLFVEAVAVAEEEAAVAGVVANDFDFEIDLAQ